MLRGGKNLKRLHQSLKKEFELKSDIVGPGGSATYSGRTIEWHEDGISIEGSDKYVDQMAEDWNMLNAPASNTPGTVDEKGEE